MAIFISENANNRQQIKLLESGETVYLGKKD